MARIAYFTGDSSYNRYELHFEYSVKQDIPNNRSTITYTMYAYYTGTMSYGRWWSGSSSWGKVKHGSTSWTDATVQSYDFRSNRYCYFVKNGTKTVNHNSDGTVNVSLALSAKLYHTSYNMTASGTVKLSIPTIPREHTFKSGNFTIGNSIPLTITKSNSGFRTRARVLFGSTVIKDWHYIEGAGSQPITLTTAQINSMYSSLPSSTSGTFKLELRTYNNTTQIGSTKTLSVTGTVGSSIKPTIGTISITDEGPTKGWGSGYWQGISKIKPSATVSAGQGASISSMSWSWAGQTSTATSPTFNASTLASGKVSLTVKDSRGRTTTVSSSTITQQAYNKPTVFKFTAERYNESNPENVRYTLTASRLVMGAAGNNQIQYRILRSKAGGGSEAVYLDWTTMSSSNISVTTTLANLVADGDYHLRVEVRDTIGSATSYNTTLRSTAHRWFQVVKGRALNLFLPNGFKVNDHEVVTAVPIDADYTEVGSGNYIEAIKENWATLPEGVSLVDIKVGSRGTSVLYKYPGGEYGYLIIFGYRDVGMQKWIYDRGNWYLQDDIDGTVDETDSFTTIGDGIGASYTRLRRRGRNIYLTIDVDYTKINNYTGSNFITVTTVNSAYRPLELTAGMVTHDSTQDVGKASCFIRPDGAIRVERAVGAKFNDNLRFNFVYPI